MSVFEINIASVKWVVKIITTACPLRNNESSGVVKIERYFHSNRMGLTGGAPGREICLVSQIHRCILDIPRGIPLELSRDMAAGAFSGRSPGSLGCAIRISREIHRMSFPGEPPWGEFSWKPIPRKIPRRPRHPGNDTSRWLPALAAAWLHPPTDFRPLPYK